MPLLGEWLTTLTLGYLNVRFFFFMGSRRLSWAAAHNVQFCNFARRRPLSPRKRIAEAYRLGSNLKRAMEVLVCRRLNYSFQYCDSAVFMSAMSEIHFSKSEAASCLCRHQSGDCTCCMCALLARFTRSISNRRWLLRLSIVYDSRAWLTDRPLDESHFVITIWNAYDRSDTKWWPQIRNARMR